MWGAKPSHTGYWHVFWNPYLSLVSEEIKWIRYTPQINNNPITGSLKNTASTISRQTVIYTAACTNGARWSSTWMAHLITPPGTRRQRVRSRAFARRDGTSREARNGMRSPTTLADQLLPAVKWKRTVPPTGPPPMPAPQTQAHSQDYLADTGTTFDKLLQFPPLLQSFPVRKQVDCIYRCNGYLNPRLNINSKLARN